MIIIITDTFFFDMFALLCTNVAAQSFAVLISVLVPDPMAGQSAGAGLFSVMFLLSGMFIIIINHYHHHDRRPASLSSIVIIMIIIIIIIIIVIIIIIIIIIIGFFIKKANIPPWWIWLHYMSIFKYAYESLCINVLAHKIETPTSTNQEILVRFSLEDISRWQGIGVLLGWAIFYRMIFYYVLLKNFNGRRKD
jgi:hypothetical protein